PAPLPLPPPPPRRSSARSAWSRADLRASQPRLYGRGVFSSVSIEPEPPGADAPQEGVVRRDVRVSVRELAPITQVFGVGYSSDRSEEHTSELQSRFDLVC